MFITCPQCGYQLVRPEEQRCTVCGYRLGTVPVIKKKKSPAVLIAAGTGAALLLAVCVMIGADLLGSRPERAQSSNVQSEPAVQDHSMPAAEVQTLPPVSETTAAVSTSETVTSLPASTVTAATTAPPVTQTPAPVTVPAPADPDAYLVAYQPIVEQALSDYGQPAYNPDSWNDGAFIRLYDCDNDGTEELYLSGFPLVSENDMGEVLIYTIVNGRAVKCFEHEQCPLTTVDTTEHLLRDRKTGEMMFYVITCDGLVPGYYGDYIMTWRKDGAGFIQNSGYVFVFDDGATPAGTRVGSYTAITDFDQLPYDWVDENGDSFGTDYGGHRNSGREELQMTLDPVSRIRSAHTS